MTTPTADSREPCLCGKCVGDSRDTFPHVADPALEAERPHMLLRSNLERIANEHANPGDASWIRAASSAVEGYRRAATSHQEEIARLEQSRDLYRQAADVNGHALTQAQEEIERLKATPAFTGCDECLKARRAQAEEVATLQAENARLAADRAALDQIQRENAQLAGMWSQRAINAEAALREARAQALEDAARLLHCGGPYVDFLRERAALERTEGQ